MLPAANSETVQQQLFMVEGEGVEVVVKLKNSQKVLKVKDVQNNLVNSGIILTELPKCLYIILYLIPTNQYFNKASSF